MSLIKRFLLSKKGRIAALAILGFAFLSFAAIVLVSEIFGFGEDEGKVYRKLEGDRVLLMNRDDNTNCPIKFQGYADTGSTRDFWWELLEASEVSLGNNLEPAVRSKLRTTGSAGKVLWDLKYCRHGNTYTGIYLTYQNYLPFSSTSCPGISPPFENDAEPLESLARFSQSQRVLFRIYNVSASNLILKATRIPFASRRFAP